MRENAITSLLHYILTSSPYLIYQGSSLYILSIITPPLVNCLARYHCSDLYIIIKTVKRETVTSRYSIAVWPLRRLKTGRLRLRAED